MSVFGAVAAFPLFLPACWLEALHLSSAVDRYRPFLWLVFLVCVVGLIFDGVKTIVIREKHKYRLRHLARDEQELLSHFVLNQVSTQTVLAFQAGAASSLARDEIVFLGPISAEEGVFYYTIKPWILRYLQKHTKYLGGFSTHQPAPPEEHS